MTPKEKAKELYWKYYQNISDTSFPEETAKQCALIAVDYILNSEPKKSYFIKGHWMTPNNFWREVKSEINQL